ncbi:MAG: tyrosine-type recombinase/integrase [Butyrivibrio sp.]|nr:tyrosine-type recombinase/integrase [Butyrivibrio sp.]
MGKDSAYYEELEEKKILKYRSISKLLPDYAVKYLDDKKRSCQINTAINYALDLKYFFEFLQEVNPLLKDMPLKSIPIDILDNLSFDDINEYQDYLELNTGDNKHKNVGKSIERHMSALRGMYKYLCIHRYLTNDATAGASSRKKVNKAIIRMDSNEVHRFMNVIENSAMSSKHQADICTKLQQRDTAILTLLLHTGIRVSECVGLDIDDIDFEADTLRIVRKGGNESILYFDEDVHFALLDYIEGDRKRYMETAEEKALFLSSRKKRMAVRSIQEMVQKYAKIAVPNKKLSPHKMRSTYGTALYKETGDIRLVADVLGHKDINTTAKHYAAIEEEHRRQAAKIRPYD